MNKKLTLVEGIEELMNILGDAPMKEASVEIDPFSPGAAQRRKETLTEEYVPVSRVTKVSNVETPTPIKATKIEPKPVDVVYGHSGAIQVGDKKVHTGPKKKGKGGSRAVKNDPVKDTLKDIYTSVIEGNEMYNKATFNHTTEGFVIRMTEADYTIKITKSKTNKFELEEDEKPEV